MYVVTELQVYFGRRGVEHVGSIKAQYKESFKVRFKDSITTGI
jgi:hypothetical protein